MADFAPWARACGAHAKKVSEAAGLKEAVRAALAHPGLALVDVDVMVAAVARDTIAQTFR